MKSATGNRQSAMFNASLALTCVRASSRAYVTATDSEPTTDTQFLILELPERIIVAFRGSSSLEDFLCDAKFLTTRINLNFNERVHLGFYQALKSIELRLKNRLDEIVARRSGVRPSSGATGLRARTVATSNDPFALEPAAAGDSRGPAPQSHTPIPIVFTGHSLGGALAILAAFYMEYFFDIEAVYTFGAPDVGNAAFSARYNRLRNASTVKRNSPGVRRSLGTAWLNGEELLKLSVVSTRNDMAAAGDGRTPLGQKTFCLGNACDPVTWLPPYRFGFRRVGKFFFLPGVAWMVPGFRAPLLARIIAGAIQVFQNWRRGKPALLPNHAIAIYKRRVERLAGVRPSPGAATEVRSNTVGSSNNLAALGPAAAEDSRAPKRETQNPKLETVPHVSP